MIHGSLFSILPGLNTRKTIGTSSEYIHMQVQRLSVTIPKDGEVALSLWYRIQAESGYTHALENDYVYQVIFETDDVGLVALGRLLSVRLCNKVQAVSIPVVNEWYLVKAQLKDGVLDLQAEPERKSLRGGSV